VVDGVQISGQPLQVNRMLIKMGDTKQLVYYWFQQRGRVVTHEYMVKWYIFWDALTRNRTDGALVRLTIPIRPGQSEEEGDKQLAAFAKEVGGRLSTYIPN
jgi:EpsI family protein